MLKLPKFKDEKLLEEAFTHSSKSKRNYELLEFLGDSLMGFVVGEYLYKHCGSTEGELSKLRAHFVSEKNLAEVFDSLKIEDKVQLGKQQKSVSKSIKADVVEALIGAIYLDLGIKRAKDFIISILNLKDFDEVENEDYKSALQEALQADGDFRLSKLTYKSVKTENGYQADVVLDDDIVGRGVGSTKTESEQAAAKETLKSLFE